MGELRDRDNQRHQELIVLQQRIDNNLKEIKDDIESTKSNIQTTNKWIMGLVISAGLAFLGIAVAVSFGMINIINIVRTLIIK